MKNGKIEVKMAKKKILAVESINTRTTQTSK
jgi:hypothetical protein